MTKTASKEEESKVTNLKSLNKNLNSDLSDNERLSAIREELVEKRHESAREEANRPHSKGPNG